MFFAKEAKKQELEEKEKKEKASSKKKSEKKKSSKQPAEAVTIIAESQSNAFVSSVNVDTGGSSSISASASDSLVVRAPPRRPRCGFVLFFFKMK